MSLDFFFELFYCNFQVVDVFCLVHLNLPCARSQNCEDGAGEIVKRRATKESFCRLQWCNQITFAKICKSLHVEDVF